MAKLGSEVQIDDEMDAFTSVFGDLVLYLRLYHGNINSSKLSTGCPNLRYIEIVGDADESISNLLHLMPDLHYLRISSTGAQSEFWKSFLGAMEASNIRELDLSSNGLSGDIIAKVADLLQKNHNVRILNLANNPIEMEGFIQIITAGVGLRVLDVSDCSISTGQKSEEVFHTTPFVTHQLRVLKLSGNNFVKRSASFWKYAFSGQKTLERLEMARTMWVQKDKDIRALIGKVAEFPNISFLDLEELAMESICFNLLLAPHCHLTRLVLTGNTIKDTIAAGLARALRYNSNLQTLSLGLVSEYALMVLDTAISENPASAIQKITATTQGQPTANLTKAHLFTLTSASDPTFTYQMRWNPREGYRYPN